MPARLVVLGRSRHSERERELCFKATVGQTNADLYDTFVTQTITLLRNGVHKVRGMFQITFF